MSDPPSPDFGAQLTDDERIALRGISRRARLEPGTTIFLEGTPPDNVVMILRGRVKIFCTAHDGTNSLLAIRGPGALIGELAAIDGEPRSASVVTLEPVELLSVTVADFTAYLGARPRLMWLLLRTLATRLRDADRKRREHGVHDTLARVATRIVELADQHGQPGPDGIRITLPITQDDLASWVGASREATAKALRILREQGCLQTQRRTITVLDITALRQREQGV